MEYSQFCPVSKAMEILGEKGTMLIVRELLMGGTRFNELQRGLSLISPTMLTKRLNELAGAGRRPAQAGRAGRAHAQCHRVDDLGPVRRHPVRRADMTTPAGRASSWQLVMAMLL